MKKGISVFFSVGSSGPDVIREDENVRNKYSRKGHFCLLGISLKEIKSNLNLVTKRIHESIGQVILILPWHTYAVTVPPQHAPSASMR